MQTKAMFFSDNINGLPAELVADILSYLDIADLLHLSTMSRTLRAILSNHNLNPWRNPLTHLLDRQTHPSILANISSYALIFPKANWITILTRSDPRFLLYECVIPHISDSDWQTAFEARFLPSWRRWKKDNFPWKSAFLRALALVTHRLESHCNVFQAWTKYIVLNRNGSANELDASSRDLDVFRTYDQLKLQANLIHLETCQHVISRLFIHPSLTIVTVSARSSSTWRMLESLLSVPGRNPVVLLRSTLTHIICAVDHVITIEMSPN